MPEHPASWAPQVVVGELKLNLALYCLRLGVNHYVNVIFNRSNLPKHTDATWKTRPIIDRFAIEIYFAQAIIAAMLPLPPLQRGLQFCRSIQRLIRRRTRLRYSCFLSGTPPDGGDCPVLVWPRIRPYLAMHLVADLSLSFLKLCTHPCITFG